MDYPPHLLVKQGMLTPDDRAFIQRYRKTHRLGVAYQLAFVRMTHRLPQQLPFEVNRSVLEFVGMQLSCATSSIHQYAKRQPTVSEHQQRIRHYLKLRLFTEPEQALLEAFLRQEAARLESSPLLMAQAKHFLLTQDILYPADSTLQRIVGTIKEQTRQALMARLMAVLLPVHCHFLDSLLDTTQGRYSLLQQLKSPPALPSAEGLVSLTDRLEKILLSGILTLDISWLNNNYQRTLAKLAWRCSAHRLRQLETNSRYTVLVCFLWQAYRDTIDYTLDMFFKLLNKVYNHAQCQLDEAHCKRRQQVNDSLRLLTTMSRIVLDEEVEDNQLRCAIFKCISKDELQAQVAENQAWLTGKYSHVFKLVVQRFSYIRRFSPALLAHLQGLLEPSKSSSLLTAIHLLHQLNNQHKRKLPEDAPMDFIPKKLRNLVMQNEQLHKPAWECAVLIGIRDALKAGNLAVKHSKRFGRFDDFFMPEPEWVNRRDTFFKTAGLPSDASTVSAYFTQRLNQAFDNFLATADTNTYAITSDKGWQLSVDPAEQLTPEQQTQLDKLKAWLAKHMRHIKLPELLIEVDNVLHVSTHFIVPTQQDTRQADTISAIIATWMVHGCSIGPYTMARLTQGVTYEQIKHITDWQLTDEAQRAALATLVNAIASLAITQSWGAGKTSSSDGQRFAFKQKVLSRTYSTSFGDFALEFYTFVADNYAPFYSTPKECTDRDAPYVLDGILYNESDLLLEEHYTDSHGYTEINFAAFAMLGKTFSPRIRNVQQQRIYCLDNEKVYGPLQSLLKDKNSVIHMEWIVEHWDTIAHFYASLASGHTTASTAMKRLAALPSSNHFYRANRELGRIFKTENILNYMSDPLLRRNRRRGLLKGEQIHQLARHVAYGCQGKISARDLQTQKNTCSSLTLIMACIIYWQANEMKRVIESDQPELEGIDLTLLEHVSPIEWENVLLYGEYVINKALIK